MASGSSATTLARTLPTFTVEETAALHKQLLSWFRVHRRRLPWRGDSPPYGGSDRESSAARAGLVGQKRMTSFFTPKAKKPRTEDDVSITSPSSTALPWPKTPSPYHTWVSEIMLQQTRVEAVLPHFEKWMTKFPTISALAAASEDDVRELWAGLGYYRRAGFLLKCAKELEAKYEAKLPSTRDALLKLPGIGEYTAGAIASIAFGQREPLVDGNVVRVFSRLRAIAYPANHPILHKHAWSLARDLLPPSPAPSSSSEGGGEGRGGDSEAEKGTVGDWNQALMELGATVCTSKSPSCHTCPIRSHCYSYTLAQTPSPASSSSSRRHIEVVVEEGDDDVPVDSGGKLILEQVPKKAVKKKPQDEAHLHALVCFRDREEGGVEVALVQRPKDARMLAGHWGPPHKECGSEDEWGAATTPTSLLPTPSPTPKPVQTSNKVKHVFSGITHHIRVWLLLNPTFPIACAEWIPASDLEKRGLSSWSAKIFAEALCKWRDLDHTSSAKPWMHYIVKRAKLKKGACVGVN